MFFAIYDIRDPSRDYTYQLLALAIFTFGCSLYLPSKRFQERAADLKNCYVALDSLNTRAEAAEKEETERNVKELVKIEKEYQELLLAHENQTDFDYLLLKFRLGAKHPDLKLDIKEWAQLVGHVKIRFIALLALLLFPFYLFYYF